jgi:alpha-L-fucosidase 2
MKRRNFLRKGALAVGLIGPLKSFPMSAKEEENPSKLPTDEIRSSEYLNRVQADNYLPKLPIYTGTSQQAGVPILPMPLKERINRNVVPRKGFCSIVPGRTVHEGITSGNGAMTIELTGDPYAEQILFRHESLLMPWKKPFEAPRVAEIFPQVRQMVMDGKYQEAIEFAFKEMEKGPIKANQWPHPTIPAFLMRFDSPKTASVKDYLRTVNFENSETNVYWHDEQGDWLRQTFTSRPDNVVVQQLTAPSGQKVNVRISLQKYGGRMHPGGNAGQSEISQDYNEQRLIYKCRLDPSVDNSGYAGVVRVIRIGGSARVEKDTLVLENASSVMLLTRIEWFSDYSEDKVESLRQAVEQLTPDYHAMLERHRKVQSEAFNRVTVDFGGASQYGMSTEELFVDQRSRQDYSPALLEKIFGMGRYWFIYTSGKYPTMVAEVNANINLQIAHGPQSDLHEGMNAYFNWMESLAPDFRVNAKNIFGMRGTHYNLWPDKGVGVTFHYSNAASTGEIWPHPYWISAGGWCMRPFWDYYLVTGNLEFLRDRIVPGYKELALFYEDFLTVADKDGNYIFVPSFSPENNPGNLNPSKMLVINASMDIAVCREVLANLIEACETLGIESNNITKWKTMIGKLPPYLLEPDGTLKEWSWAGFEERYSHRHISHLYGAWPGDEIDPDRTPKLALAAVIADRKRVPERLAAHGRCHRALVGARLKDNFMVDTELRQLIEQGYVAATLRCSHDPYVAPMPDAQGGLIAIIQEMLLYSRPGVIEVLPALPPSIQKGSINGMLARTYARIDKLAWNMQERTVYLTITSARKQDITLIARYGIEDITAPSGILKIFQRGKANCDLHLPEKETVEIRLKLGQHMPSDWVAHVP